MFSVVTPPPIISILPQPKMEVSVTHYAPGPSPAELEQIKMVMDAEVIERANEGFRSETREVLAGFNTDKR